MTETFGGLVREKWASLLTSGFEITREDQCVVALASAELVVMVAWDPRGEVDVWAFPLGWERSYGWTYTGLVGRASVGRLLELALEEMKADPAILSADPDFYVAVERDSRRYSEALTEYYSGQGPRPPRRGPLP